MFTFIVFLLLSVVLLYFIYVLEKQNEKIEQKLKEQTSCLIVNERQLSDYSEEQIKLIFNSHKSEKLLKNVY